MCWHNIINLKSDSSGRWWYAFNIMFYLYLHQQVCRCLTVFLFMLKLNISEVSAMNAWFHACCKMYQEVMPVHCSDQRHLRLCLGYIPGHTYEESSCRVYHWDTPCNALALLCNSFDLWHSYWARVISHLLLYDYLPIIIWVTHFPPKNYWPCFHYEDKIIA